MEVYSLNDSMMRLQRRPKCHESERKIAKTPKHTGSKCKRTDAVKLKIVPGHSTPSMRRQSSDSDPGSLYMQTAIPSVMRESLDE